MQTLLRHMGQALPARLPGHGFQIQGIPISSGSKEFGYAMPNVQGKGKGRKGEQ
jgi:hypothetical protein